MGRSPDRLSSSYHAAVRTGSPSMSNSSEPPLIPHAMSQSFDSPGLMYKKKHKRQGHASCALLTALWRMPLMNKKDHSVVIANDFGS
ncbi:unnamed protein product [Parnassius apollo]|uniref:(apollo) hypothetical protein n=1 Tax=Parnassius apollo TaxID=110799 RepID=A0A8S3XK18_PARAO|nr:unnamed protein product [Parnassius apollo]